MSVHLKRMVTIPRGCVFDVLVEVPDDCEDDCEDEVDEVVEVRVVGVVTVELGLLVLEDDCEELWVELDVLEDAPV